MVYGTVSWFSLSAPQNLKRAGGHTLSLSLYCLQAQHYEESLHQHEAALEELDMEYKESQV